MITSKRFEMGLFKMNLVRTDIIPIVNYAWQKSFANVKNNLKAIADRGWGPLNRILLSHPEIISSKIESFDSQENEQDGLQSQAIMDDNIAVSNTPHHIDNNYLPIPDLNFNTGYAGDVITSILRKAQRDQQILKNISESNKQGSNFITSMGTAKKFSAGVIFKHGMCYLDKDILSMAINARQKKEKHFKERICKLYKNYHDKKKLFEDALVKYNEWEKHCKSNDKQSGNLPLRILKPLVAWKKRKSDKALPSKLEPLMERWNETKDRSHQCFESFLKETSIFDAYKKETGRQLTMDIVNDQLTENPTNNDQRTDEQVCVAIQHDKDDRNDVFAVTAV